MRILALTQYDRLGASSRVRWLQYLPLLEAVGIEVDVRPLLGDAYIQRLYAGRPKHLPSLARAYGSRLKDALQARRYDLVWIEKQLLPWVPGIIERGALLNTPYVVDYDDATFHSYDQHPNPIVRRLMGGKIDRVMRGATLVVAGSDYLAERAQRAGARRVEIIPSVIDLERYGTVSDMPDGPFTIGWIGSPGSEQWLGAIRDELYHITSDPEVKLVLVGAHNPPLDGVPFTIRPWSLDTEVEEMRRFHVGIMPMPDRPFTRGKCGFKLIQCMGVARPVVASPVGANNDIVVNGKTGYLPRSSGQWIDYINRLRADRDVATQMGRDGRRRVANLYDLSVTAPHLAGILKGIKGRG